MPIAGIGRVSSFARTVHQNAGKYGKAVTGFAGRGLVKARDLPAPVRGGLGHGGQSLRNSDRVALSVTQNGAHRAQPRVYRGGSQSAGSFISNDVYKQTIRNRNVRYAGYGSMVGGIGMANAVTSNNKRSYTGPASRINTAKGVGRSA
jgi:hypothetical protein